MCSEITTSDAGMITKIACRLNFGAVKFGMATQDWV